MRIAQVAPLCEAVPPHLYGGTELVVSDLTEALVQQGHDVTLFASGDSRTSARLVPVVDRSLRLAGRMEEETAMHLALAEEVERQAAEFDVVHFQVDTLHLPVARRIATPAVTTRHGRLDVPGLRQIYAEYDDMPLISISDAQRRPLPEARWLTTIHHGMAPDRYSLEREPGSYLAFLGRISPEKRVDRAIEIARQADMPLKVAAKIDDVDREYFEREIEPLFEDPRVEYVGEVGDDDKNAFLRHAAALLFPIDWPEPFGLVMIESMATGTPVIAWSCGSVPEVIEDGVNGFVADSVEAAASAVRRLGDVSRAGVRASFEQRFTAERMARDHVAAYRDLIMQRQARDAAQEVRSATTAAANEVAASGASSASIQATADPRWPTLRR